MRAALGAALAALLPAVLAAAPPARTETKVRYTPADRAQGRYQYVPVEVPPGTTSLTVAYAYDKAGGANVVDLGLFEPGSLDLGTLAFRGWSGGERTEVTLSGTEATPGYWPGPIPAGRWHVALGLYKVADAGVEVTVTVEAR